MDIGDALELLSSTFGHADVRKYAISRLDQATDDDLLLYLLQLVQALKYENFVHIFDVYKQVFPESKILKSIDDSESNSNSNLSSNMNINSCK